jgi:hypothetical protein
MAKRRQHDQSTIPLIEYHLVDNDSPRAAHAPNRWSGGARPKADPRRSVYGENQMTESGESEGGDFFPDESPRPATRCLSYQKICICFVVCMYKSTKC